MSDNAAEKAREARVRMEAAKLALKEARREKISSIFHNIFSLNTLSFLILIGSAILFVYQAMGASGMDNSSLQMQKITFYVGIGAVVLDAIFIFVGFCDDTRLQIVLITGHIIMCIALFVLGCVGLFSGRMFLNALYYDETNGVTYAEQGDGCVVWSIDGSKENVTILAEYNGHPVIKVNNRVAKGNTKLKTLTLSSNSELTLDESAFENCSSLTEVFFAPNGDYVLGKESFVGCSALTNLSFGDSSEFHIWKRVFAECNRLTNVDCGTSNVLYFDEWNAFENCTRLTEFHVNNSRLVINEELNFNCDKTIFGGATNATIYVSGGDTSYIADSVGGIVIGMNSNIGFALYVDDINVGICRFEEGFDFARSNLFTAKVQTHFFYHSTDYQAFANEIFLPASVTFIPDNFFGDYGDGCKVYYAGTEEQWKALKIGENGNSNYSNNKVTVVYEYSE